MKLSKIAAELISQGASVRQAARKAGVGDGTAQRAKKLISGAPAPTEPPAGGQPLPAGPSPTASALPQAPDVPAGAPDPEYLADAARNYGEAIGAIRDTLVASGAARLHPAEIDITIPDVLRRA